MILSDEQLKGVLLQAKIIDEKKFAEIYTHAKESQQTLLQALIEANVITAKDLGTRIAQSVGLTYVDLSAVTIAEDVFSIIPERIARKYNMVAFGKNDQGIAVVVSSKVPPSLLSSLEKKTGQKIQLYYALDHEIASTFVLYKKDLQSVVEGLLKDDDTGFALDEFDDSPVAKIVDVLLLHAYQEKASDIHIEPQEKEFLVRFRIDGVLQDVLKLPKPLHERIITRIKVLSDLRTDEHLSAQDGKLRFKSGDEDIDVRVSILPIVEGEKVVMRLLASGNKEYSLSDLGMSDKDLKVVTKAYTRSYGMILCTGPTGSGKTTSIYAMLRVLNTREKNLTTIEDPVEYRIKGANQIQVNVKTNLTFANGLRSILRQDPNIILVGEIRDNETAGIAVNAALTGHLVFSTLHTNDAATAIPRLIDMKVEPFLVASTVNVVIAQRLVRRICDTCRVSQTITEEELLQHLSKEILDKHYIPVGKAKEIRVYHGKGCKACHFTGYQGRIGIYEVLEITKGIRELITSKTDADVIARAAVQEGMTTFLDDGLQKVAKGLTTIEEVLRVTKTEAA